MNSKIIALGFALVMALIDVMMFPIVKNVQLGYFNMWWLIIAVLLYSVQPIILYNALSYSNVLVLNISWDLLSDILVSLMALFILKEQISRDSQIGLLFAIIAIYFFAKGNMDK